jgi:bifunctional N-acetylglucosamine-1-phosphate-uridyltransferase/glucosamine-1-phosphate-acetyltransferase GlmU-like protein
MQIIIYEDELYKNFIPLAWTRPVFSLRCGINTLAEKIVRQYPRPEVAYSYRYYLPGKKLMKLGKGLFINGRVMTQKLSKLVPLKGQDEVFVCDDEIIAVRAVTKDFNEIRKRGKVTKIKAFMIKNLWDLLAKNEEQINEDRKYFKLLISKKIHNTAVLYNPSNIIIDDDVEIEANTVIDARNGAVYIGRGSIIRPFTYLKGPLSLGPHCRIGGEVSESIFLGYCNKQHYGFLGNAYVGEWVNLGAGTTNSNLKNNYGTVKVLVNGKNIDTGKRFVGCFIGDHAKTGIGTLINTGALIGVAANVFGGGVTSKFVSSFSWGNNKEYKVEKMLETAELMMARRERKLFPEDKNLLQKIYKLTAAERRI